MAERVRFGILGTGNIARQFAAGLNASHGCKLVAVGSRQEASARSFAGAHQAQAAYGSYEALLADRDVQVIYNALPNSMHYEWTIKALRAGKHVLCEKPLAVNAAQSEEMFDVAQRSGQVLMEAFMYRSHPLTLAVVEAVKSGAIGELRLIRTSFCYRTTRIADNIRFSAEMAGGALMDIGCYCISYSRLFAGQEPAVMMATAHLHESGVDDLTAGTLRFANGVVASFTCGMQVQADNAAHLCGSDGFIEVPVPWKPPAKQAAYTIARGTPPRMDSTSGAKAPAAPPPRQTLHVDTHTDLYGVEADDFAETVQQGRPPRISPQETLGNMRVLDELRRQVGVRVERR
jgi:predicted dehydrogenase